MTRISTTLLETYRSGKLHELWKEKTRVLAQANPTVPFNRVGQIVAAMLAHDLANEVKQLEDKVRPSTMTPEEEALYDWLEEGNNYYLTDLQIWSGSRTMLADIPTYEYEPEWKQYIRIPEYY